MNSFQTTIKKEVTLTGVGLHTGKNVTLKFTPAEANSGYKFIRYDLEDSPVVEADVQWVTDTQRGTNLLGVNAARFQGQTLHWDNAYAQFKEDEANQSKAGD